MLRRVIVSSARAVLQFRPHFQTSSLLINQILFKFGSTPKDKNNNHLKQQQLKQNSKQFYSNYVENIVELKSSADFEKLVVNTKQPIILDLYADWCEPCKKLTPRLEAKVNSLTNVKMIKINIDKCPEIAHALQVKSVPTVFLLHRGQAVDKFQGNVGENEFNKFFETINKLTGESPEAKEAIQTLQKAKTLIGTKKFAEAAQTLQKFKQKKVSIDLIAIKQLLLTQCYLSQGKVSKFKDSLTRASKFENFYKEVPDLGRFYSILRQQIMKFEQQSKQDPQIKRLIDNIGKAEEKQGRLSAKFQLINYYKSKQMTQEALQTAMEIIKEDKNWQEKKTNLLVLSILKQLGSSSPLAQKYRKILQRLLS